MADPSRPDMAPKTVAVKLVAMAVSVLFSLVVIAGNPIPNDDAFGYIRAAEMFTAQGLAATLSAYGWYGYSVLIAVVGKLLPIGLFNSAHLLNTLSFALLVYAFISLVLEFRQTRQTAVFAAIAILCFPTINELRYNLIRDFAYWAFSLTALVQLIRFNRHHHAVNAAGWLLAMTAAIFFRLEGMILLALSPLALLLPGQAPISDRVKYCLLLLVLLVAGFVLVMLLFLPAGINLLEIFSFAWRWYLPLLSEYPETLAGAASNTTLSVHISGQLALFTGKGLPVLVFGYCYAVLANLFMSIGPVFSLFILAGLAMNRSAMPPATKWPWLLFLAGSMVALLVFVSIMQFLTTRYAVMAGLLLLVLMPLTIDDIYSKARQYGREQKFRIMAAVAIFYFTVDSLVSFGYSKHYIEDAIGWSQANIPPGNSLLTNSAAIAYFTGLVADYDRVLPDPAATLSSLARQDFLAMELAGDDAETRALLSTQTGLAEQARFENRRGDAVIIYRVSSP